MAKKDTHKLTDDHYVPVLRSGALLRVYGNEAVAWSPIALRPVYLDPVARIVVQIVDGTATIRDLVEDVHEVLSIGADAASQQIRRVVTMLNAGGLLTDSTAVEGTTSDLELFTDPPND